MDESGALAAAWLLCRAGRHLCALPIEHVVETMRVLPIEALSAAPGFVRGLCVYRGSPVPVVDAGWLLGQDRTDPNRMVVIRVGARLVALSVGTVVGIRSFGTETTQALPPLLREATSEAVSAIGILDAELLLFLGAARLVPETVLALAVAEALAS